MWLEQGGHALWKTGKMVKKNSLQGKIREFEILLKIREISGNFKKSYLCKVKIFKFYSCSDVATGGFFFCHMLKIPADLILLKGGVLLRWSTCLLYILCFLFLIPKWTFYCKPNVCHKILMQKYTSVLLEAKTYACTNILKNVSRITQ